MHLDVPTVIVLGFVISVGASIGFSLLLAVLHEQPVLRLWVASLWVATAGVVLIGLRNQIPDSLSIIAGNGGIALGSILLLRGVAMHVGGPWRWWRPLVLLAVYCAAMAWYAFVTPDLGMRFTFASLQTILWDIWGIVLLLRYAPREIRISCRIAAAIMVLEGFYYTTRLFTPISPLAGQDVMKADSPVAATYIVGILIGLAMYFAMLLLITERLMVDLRRVARLDGLTGLLNRGAIISMGTQALKRCRQRDQPFALLIFDLDRFKQINDTWGHEAGDAVLQHVTGVLHESTHWPGSLSSRYGGEEFVMALPNAKLREALDLAEDLRAALAATPAYFGDHAIPVTTSIGVAMADRETPFESVVAQADEALYRAKAEGRNRVSPA
ncbi:MAG TPA: GGDEF domain-containing protein [Luteibacter sp.]|jgi:diguanylate cyclase (GGDEF)-like protein|nr:GGDEF domain-containing protein [Luteibacter sp.]